MKTKEEDETDLRAKLAKAEADLMDYEASFDLYDKATRVLSRAYTDAHPERDWSLTWPDTSTVCAWAALELVNLRTQLEDEFDEHDASRALARAAAAAGEDVESLLDRAATLFEGPRVPSGTLKPEIVEQFVEDEEQERAETRLSVKP